MSCSLYAFEGPDGVGKSSLSCTLNHQLGELGLPSQLMAFPGRDAGTLGEHIYRLYHSPSSFGVKKISVISEQLLVTAAHTDVIENQVLPTLCAGSNVILDRYWWSTWVYSTFSGLKSDIRNNLLEIELSAWRGVKPDIIFYVRRPRPSDSEYSPEEWRELVELYEKIRTDERHRTKIIDVENIKDLKGAAESVLKSVMGHHNRAAVNRTHVQPRSNNKRTRRSK
jgi:thymidylate kinase